MNRGAWQATLQSMGLQRVRHDSATECTHIVIILLCIHY